MSFQNIGVAALTTAVLLYLFSGFSETKKVTSTVDNNAYVLRNKYKTASEMQKSADTLAEINARVLRLIDHIVTTYANDPKKADIGRRLRTSYKKNTLSEAAVDVRYTTYTIDKQDIHICLRTRNEQHELYDMNVLMYVLIHELAHMANYDSNGNPILGHGKDFMRVFKFLTKEAVAIGVYQYRNYAAQPQEYCGMTITSNVLLPFEAMHQN
jgi:hypothetical protein